MKTLKKHWQLMGLETVALTDDAYQEWQSIAMDAVNLLAGDDAFEGDLLKAVEIDLQQYREGSGS